ncbi:MAG: cell division protein SepF [Actinomycetota bacterium]
MREMWKKTLIGLGLMDEDEEFEESLVDEEPSRRDEGQMVRTVRRDGRDERGHEDRHPAGRGVVRSIPTAAPRQIRVVEPRIFDDAQEFADQFKGGIPVIINLRMTEQKHAPKILQFASGLVYGLNGRMQKVGEQVFLLTPFNMEVSADEKRRLAEHGLFGEF